MSESRPDIRYATVVLDTDDPARLGEFYSQLLGWEITYADDDWVKVGVDGAAVAMQLALNYRPPTWPDASVPQQLHLDLRVSDMAAAQAYAESIGATVVEGEDRHEGWVVLLDPSGHPFCLCR